MRFLVVLLVLAGPAVVAIPAVAAPPCGDPGRAFTGIEALSRFAVDPTTKEDVALTSYLDTCFADVLRGDRVHFNTACETILARDPQHVTCITGAIAQKRRGTFDLVRALDASPWHTQASRVLALHEQLGDPRAVGVVIERWTAAIAEATGHAERPGWQGKHAMLAWRRWQVDAAHLLGVLGTTASARDFLEKQAVTTDVAVARACRDAMRAIAKRKR